MNVTIFCEEMLYALSSRDVASFFRSVMERESFKDKYNSMLVSAATCFPDKIADKMERVTISFQMYAPGQSGYGDKYYFRCFRAKDWSCANISIEKA